MRASTTREPTRFTARAQLQLAKSLALFWASRDVQWGPLVRALGSLVSVLGLTVVALPVKVGRAPALARIEATLGEVLPYCAALGPTKERAAIEAIEHAKKLVKRLCDKER
ncbi:MAG: hypothetical protein Q8Q09_25690 [Deltaproteobacteria bacterium]|nr:hypothetical protein [Deltaproteobacteria bacterium]